MNARSTVPGARNTAADLSVLTAPGEGRETPSGTVFGRRASGGQTASAKAQREEARSAQKRRECWGGNQVGEEAEDLLGDGKDFRVSF